MKLTNQTHTIRFSSTIIMLAILGVIFFTSFSSAFTENAQTLNKTTFESARETFTLNMTTTGTITADFLFNNTRRTATVIEVGPDTLVTGSLDMPLVGGSVIKNLTWEINFNNGTIVNATQNSTTVQNSVFNLCGVGGATVPYINFSYKNETVAKEDITALISGSSFVWYLGSGTVSQTFTYSNAAEAASHAFCVGGPEDRTMYVNIDDYNFDNSESEQRTYSPGILALTNSTTDTTLWLLPINDGVYSEFQVINLAEQPISGAVMEFSRAGYGVITTVQTGGSGTVSVWLNPNFAYTLTVSKTGYTTLTETQKYDGSQGYTITLGGGETLVDDYTRDVTLDVEPAEGVLRNNTIHNFNATLTSGYWDVTEFGFVLYNSTGSNVGSTSILGTGIINLNYNPQNDTSIEMNLYYVVNNTYLNSTYKWTIDQEVRRGTIAGFLERFGTYAGQGWLGLTAFNLQLLAFIIIFLFMGVFASKAGNVDSMDLAFLGGTILAIILFAFNILTSIPVLVITVLFMVGIIYRRVGR